jgi:hypothetical protein
MEENWWLGREAWVRALEVHRDRFKIENLIINLIISK